MVLSPDDRDGACFAPTVADSARVRLAGHRQSARPASIGGRNLQVKVGFANARSGLRAVNRTVGELCSVGIFRLVRLKPMKRREPAPCRLLAPTVHNRQAI